MAYFLRYLAAKNNKPKIKVTFASLGCLAKNRPFFGGQELSAANANNFQRQI
jgi:hypothetical protein